MTQHILKIITLLGIAFGSSFARAQNATEILDEQTTTENNTEEYSDIIIIKDSKTGEKHTLVWMEEGYFLDLEYLKYQKHNKYVTRQDVTKETVKKKPSFVGAVTSLSNAIINPLCSILKFSTPLIPVLVSTYSVWGKYFVGINGPVSQAQDLSLDGITW